MVAYISTDLKFPIFQIKNQNNSTCFNKLKLNSHIIINKNYKTYCKIKMDDLNDFEDSELDPETRKLREKQAEIERLRAAEKFMEIDEGKFECQACGYIYEPETGDKFAGIPAGTEFSQLPDTFSCPACRSPKSQFKNIKKSNCRVR